MSDKRNIQNDDLIIRELENFLYTGAVNSWNYLFGSDLLGVLICDDKGKILRNNNAHKKITGTAIDEICGKTMEDLVKEGYLDSSIVMDIIKQNKEGKKIGTVIQTQSIYTGKQYVACTTPLIDGEGRLRYFVSQLMDITLTQTLKTDLEKAQNENLRMKKLMKTLPRLLESRREQAKSGDIPLVLYTSKKMKSVFSFINNIENSASPVLITGETGVGKELVAKSIHRMGARRDAPLVDVNCAALPPSLLESELFGYKPGVFTGGDPKGKRGLFEAANGGTLILDEICEMAPELQAKLLRVLQEKEVRPIGATKSIPIDVRVISITNRELEQSMRDGAFRRDLYYRLNVIPLNIPPLRERREDIPLLTYHFLEHFNRKYGKAKQISSEGLLCLMEQNFEGNIRQLENTIERLVMLCLNNTISAADVIYFYSMMNGAGDDESASAPADLPWKQRIKLDEESTLREMVQKKMSTYQIADALGMNQSTVWRKLKKLKA